MDPYSSQYTNAKHWCTLCKTFIQRDSKSIKFHEDSNRHQNKVKRKLTLAARRKEDELPRPMVIASTPEEAGVQIALRSDEVLGQYSVRNQVYLQGEMHEDILMVKGGKVELSLLDEDGEFAGWVSCQVLTYNVLEKDADPYTVSFRLEGELQMGQVSAKDLRILGPNQPPVFSMQQWKESTPLVVTEEEEEEEEQHGPVVVEYYKGVALDDLEDDSVRPSSTSAVPITFRKRNRIQQQQ
ncbi:hypothetical protein BASA81_006176 [Batrachochytrium salamandrivorans]|nr:hypothetical protein BASA81_006176 [Batrachochytrium salamandrivorans]